MKEVVARTTQNDQIFHQFKTEMCVAVVVDIQSDAVICSGAKPTGLATIGRTTQGKPSLNAPMIGFQIIFVGANPPFVLVLFAVKGLIHIATSTADVGSSINEIFGTAL